MTKTILFLVALCSVTSAFDRSIDSILIVQKSFLQFVAVNRLEFQTLEYQLYIQDLIPLMERNQFDVRSALVLEKNRAEKYLQRLAKHHEYTKMIEVIKLQRYATTDNTVYSKALIRAYSALDKSKNIYIEVKNLLQKKKISYQQAVDYTRENETSTFLLKREFSEYKAGKTSYNQFAFLQMAKVDPLNAVMFLSNLMNDDEKFLRESLVPVLEQMSDKQALTQAFFIVNSSLGDSIKYEFDILLSNIVSLKNNFDSLSSSQRVRFVDIYIRDMLKAGEFNPLDSKFIDIQPKEYSMTTLRYFTALQYRKVGNIYNYADTISIKDSLQLNYLYEVALFQLFDRKNRDRSIVTKYKNLVDEEGELKRFTLWKNLYASLNRKKKQDISILLTHAIKLDVNKFKALSKKLKKRTIEQKVLISFIELNYYDLKYAKDDIFEWYEGMKFLEDGTFVMIASEQFFLTEDLLNFYQSRLATENDDVWKRFLENRVAFLLSEG